MYVKTQWVNNTTPINDTNLNKIEQGIYDNSLVVDAVTNTINPTDTEIYKTAELTEGQITDVIGVNDIVIKGQTSQNGTPTPSAPVDVNVVSGSNIVNTSNKNLFIPTLIYNGRNINQSNCTVSLQKDKFIFEASGSDMYFGHIGSTGTTFVDTYGVLYKVLNNKTIRFTITNTTFNKNFIVKYDKDKKILGYQQFNSNSGTITFTDNVEYYSFRIGYGNAVVGTTYKTKIQVEQGSTATTYEPHQGKELPLDLPVENLFDVNVSNASGTSLTNNGIKLTYKDGYINLKGTATAQTDFYLFGTWSGTTSFINLKTGQYTTSITTSNKLIRFYINKTSATISVTDTSAGVNTFTLSENTDVTSSFIRIPSGTKINENVYLQIEKDSKANAYTLYGTDPIELCKIGDYQDYFYRDNGRGKWYLHKEIGKTIFNGSETWSYSTGNFVFYTDALILSKTNSNLFCNRFLKVNNSTTYANMNTGEIKYDGLGSKRIIIKYTNVTSAADLKTWLASNNTTVYYPLETATDTEITDTTLISQLEATYNSPLYEQTNITQTNNDLPMVLDITACKDNINGIKAFIRK